MGKRKNSRLAKRRMAIWKMQNLRCAGCGELAYPHLHWRHPRAITLDEVLPRAKGGQREWGNQIVMHRKCNAKKGDRLPTGCQMIWLSLVNARLQLIDREGGDCKITFEVSA
jgi:5-methylcytosine-specific restriction endonuclease McrA